MHDIEYKYDQKDIEYKDYIVEFKEIDEKGNFKGLLAPYDNVDFGNDRVLKSCGPRNNNKKVHFLWQHEKKTIVGELELFDTKQGIAVDGKVFLDKDGSTYMIPKAAETYALMKHNMLKLSMGYFTIKKSYDSKGVRNLEDIDIVEGSAVTFPMNPKAKISEVKEEGSSVDDNEKKASSFNDVMAAQEMRDKRWKLVDALNTSLRSVLSDQNMTADDKKKAAMSNIDQFAAAYKLVFDALITSQKDEDIEFEIKDFLQTEELEIKKGAKISKANMSIITKAIEALKALVDMEAEEEPKGGMKPGEEPKGAKKPKEKSKDPDKLELKADEITLDLQLNSFGKKEETE